jgi:hypothetical protein
MEIINKNHPEINVRKFKQGQSLITFHKIGVYFSARACELYYLKPGTRVEFIFDENVWYFAKSTNKDGFPLGKKGTGLLCKSVSLILFFQKKSRYINLPVQFGLTVTLKELHGEDMIKILTDKPLT